MKDIYYYISKLPKPLQDLINEFNVEHRTLYKKVMTEIESKFRTCRYCQHKTRILMEEPYYNNMALCCPEMVSFIQMLGGMCPAWRYSN